MLARLEIVSFSEEHVGEAAALLAARHRAERACEPRLPLEFEHVSAARTRVQAALVPESTRGVAALRNGQLVGYLLGATQVSQPASLQGLVTAPRGAFLPYEGHAADPDLAEDVYPAMYEVLAANWVREGYFTHYVQTAVHEQCSLQVWFSLGFGQTEVRAMREISLQNAATTSTEPSAEAAGSGSVGAGQPDRFQPATRPDADRQKEEFLIRRAGPGDIDIVASLSEGLVFHHLASPALQPYPPECQAALRSHMERVLADGSSACWIAFRANRPGGLVVLVPPRAGMPMVTPEKSVFLQQSFTVPEYRGHGLGAALLERALAWARAAGYEWCALEWRSANRPAARFWLDHQFRPVSYRLCRQIDERIAWARGPA